MFAYIIGHPYVCIVDLKQQQLKHTIMNTFTIFLPVPSKRMRKNKTSFFKELISEYVIGGECFADADGFEVISFCDWIKESIKHGAFSLSKAEFLGLVNLYLNEIRDFDSFSKIQLSEFVTYEQLNSGKLYYQHFLKTPTTDENLRTPTNYRFKLKSFTEYI